jgi:hypothetical protein
MRAAKALKACEKKLDISNKLFNRPRTYGIDPEPKSPRSSNENEALCFVAAF